MPEPTSYTPVVGELSNYSLHLIASGLLKPNAEAIKKMVRELRKWRGEKDPDLI